MNNRIFISSTPSQSPAFGLVGWLEQTRVQLPLKGVECRFHSCADLLSVEIDQIFHQNNPQPMDCLYTFPLPAGAAVHRCEMYVNGRVIRARVEEQSRAREIAREQKAAGRRTALVETERDNLFSLSLGNLQPGDVVVIRFAYFQTLTRLADWTSLRIPFCPGVRYVPGEPLLRGLSGRGAIDDTDQVPDASRISPPRIDALHPDAAYLSVHGILESAPGSVAEISSPSHPVLVRDGDGQWTVTLAQNGAVPEGDFALRWTEVRSGQLRSAGWRVREGNDTYALVLLQAPAWAAPVAPAAQDFYFLVDRSGSMQGLKWQKAVQSFRAFLNHLGPEDRAWATFFESAWRDFAEKPLTAREFAADGGLAALEKLGTGGGTELLPALQHVLATMRQHSAGRETALILITDGQVGNEQAILECLRPHPEVRVHTFGIDTAVNDALLTRLATQQRGSCCLLQPTDDIVGAVTRVGLQLRRPVLTHLRACDGWELAGAGVPDLHSGECLSLSLKINSADAREVVIRGTRALSPAGGEGGAAAGGESLLGRTSGSNLEEVLRLPLLDHAEPAVRLLWVSQRIRHLLDQNRRPDAIALARQHNLLCEGAAFIAWDEAEKVSIANREFYQPSIDQKLFQVEPSDAVFCQFGIQFFERRLSSRDPRDVQSHDFHADPRDAETGAFIPSYVGAAPAPGSIGPYRDDSQAGGATDVSTARHLQALLARLPRLELTKFQGSFGRRLRQWCQYLGLTFAFPPQVGSEALIVLLVEWMMNGAAESEQQMTALEDLIEQLVWEAPDPETGLALTRRWMDTGMAAGDAFRPRLLALLDVMSQRVADIRQREREEGTQILPYRPSQATQRSREGSSPLTAPES